LAGGNNLYQYVSNPIGLGPLATSADRGCTGVIQNANGGLHYAASNALYDKLGVNATQKISYSGDYILDFETASMQALGKKSTPK
jgi:hypothetical protein